MTGIRGIRPHLTAVFAFLTVAPLVLIGLLLSWQLYHTQKSAAIALQKEVAKRVIKEMSTVSVELADDLRSLVLVADLVDKGPQGQREALALIKSLTFRQQKHIFNDISLLDQDGHERIKLSRLKVVGSADLRDYSNDEMFTIPLIEKRNFYGPLQTTPGLQEVEMIISIPLIETRTGKVSAVLAVTVRLNRFLETLTEEGVSHKISIFIANESGVVVSHDDPSIQLAAVQITVPVEGEIVVGFDGEKSVRATQLFEFGSQSLYLVCDYHVREAFLGVTRSLFIVVFFVISFLIVSLVVAYRVVSPIVGNIEALGNVALAVFEGDYGKKAVTSGNDEVAFLGKAMNTMTTRLVGDIERRRQAEESLTEEIAERVWMEKVHEAIKVKALAQNKLATLGEVATGVAHEINQPLSYIKIIFESAAKDLEEGKLDQKELLGECQESLVQVRRISIIIDHLRTFGRDETMVKEEVDLVEIWRNTIIIFGQRIRLSNISIKEDFGEHSTVFGNGLKLEQLFINLLQNALDAMKEKGTGELEVRIQKEKEMVEVIFADTGTGIPAEVQEKMFEPFFTTKDVGEGTGLGLAIAYGIVMDHGGTIDCQSQVGQSTAFTIRFPWFSENL